MNIIQTGKASSVQKSFCGPGMAKYISRHLIVIKDLKTKTKR